MDNLDKDGIDQMLRWWQQVLNINHWRIAWKVVDDTKLGRSLMEIRPTSVRQHAVIFIRKSTLRISSTREFEKLLVHELVHLIYDPLAEEHKVELDFVCDSQRQQEEYRFRFTQVLEKAVEHTSQLLCSCLNFPLDRCKDNGDIFVIEELTKH